MIVLKALILKKTQNIMQNFDQLCSCFKTVVRPYSISFYTANTQLTAKLIRLTNIYIDITLYHTLYHTKETNAKRLAKTFNFEHSNGRIIMCCNPFTFRKTKAKT